MSNWYVLSDSTTGKWAPAQAVRQIKLGRASTTNENASPFTQTGIDMKLQSLRVRSCFRSEIYEIYLKHLIVLELSKILIE